MVGNKPSCPLVSSRPPCIDPMPVITPNVLNLFNNTKPMIRCGNTECTICPRLIIANSIHVRKLHYNVRLPPLTPALTCCTKRVVYVIKCKVHHKAYVGQTGKIISTRVRQHLATVKSFKRSKMTSMGHHFDGNDCSLSNLVWAPLDKISDDLTNREAELLKTRETFWIQKLCSMQPWGMNCYEVDTDQNQTLAQNIPPYSSQTK